MSFRTRFDAAATVELVLACDPAVVETNTTEALNRYQQDGDSGELTIPDEAVRVTVRPLTPRAKRAASRRAGRPSHRGSRVDGRKGKDPAVKEARKALALAQARVLMLREGLKEKPEGASGKELAAELLEALDEAEVARDDVADAEADWYDSLSDEDVEALARWNYYINDRMEALVGECLVEWRGHKDAEPDPVLAEGDGHAFLASLKPEDRALVCAELWFHIHNLGELGDEGKARFERGLGCAPPSDSAPPPTGTAPSAEEQPSSSVEAAEAPSVQS